MKQERISSRKQQHVELTIGRDVTFRHKSAGFERWEFVHNALPELDVADIDPRTRFLGKELSLPLMITGMTGGYGDALRINRGLAEVCAERRLALGVGSQRQALESKEFHRSYSVVREVAPAIPIVGNIGAAEVAKLKDASTVQRLVELIRADALAVHLNPLQEFLQPEGNTEFRGVLQSLGMLVRQLAVPVIVKEIGAGISAAVAKRLLEVGVTLIDVAGAGGTSWAGVELLRRHGKKSQKKLPLKDHDEAMNVFWDWGIPTVDAVRQVSSLKAQYQSLTVIASGGITNGIDVAKSIAFGADLAGAARPFLKALEAGGAKELMSVISGWEQQVKGAMFLTGCKRISDLQRQQLVLRA